jgi:hypothetical protein
MKRLLLLALVVGCSKPPPPKPPAEPPSKCANVADHLLSLMSPTAQEPTETLDKFRAMFNTRCREDAWSPEAQDCFLAATTLANAAEQCESKLTPEQTQAFGASIQSASSQNPNP